MKLVVVSLILIVLLVVSLSFCFSPSESNDWHDEIDAFLYINLYYRTDRKKKFEGEMKLLGVPKDKIIRIEAELDDSPYRGCTLSHIKALKLAKEKRYNKICLFEDDFMVNVSVGKFNGMINQSLRYHQTVTMMACTPIRFEKITKRVGWIKQALAMPALIISFSYYDELLRIYQQAIELNTPHDMLTQKYQERDKWVGFYPPISIQRPGYSDIEKKYQDYYDFEVNGSMLQV
jgi:hypothetical protein